MGQSDSSFDWVANSSPNRLNAAGPQGRYRTIVADPPWRYGSTKPPTEICVDYTHAAPDGPTAVARQHCTGLTVKDVAAHFPSRTGAITGCVSNWEQESNRPTPTQWRTLRDIIGRERSRRSDDQHTTCARRRPNRLRAAARHYETLGLEEIRSLPVGEMVADDAHLWIWGVNAMLDKAFDVARAWAL